MRVNQHPVNQTIFNVSGLIEDREYEFRIFAVNEAGESRPSSGSRKVKVRDPNGKLYFKKLPHCAQLSLSLSEIYKMLLVLFGDIKHLVKL